MLNVGTEKVIKEQVSTVIKLGSSFYIRIPPDFVRDSAFPLLILKIASGKLKKGAQIRIKMLEDKLIVEEE